MESPEDIVNEMKNLDMLDMDELCELIELGLEYADPSMEPAQKTDLIAAMRELEKRLTSN